MKYCTRCLYPANHPYGIVFDDQGVCSGCRVHEEKDELDWDGRGATLGRLFDRFRSTGGRNFDCVIPVTGGGDSYFIVHTVKKVYGLQPLLVHYNHHYNTRLGIRNLANLATVFDCDLLTSTPDPGLLKRITRHTLRRYGSMYWHCLAGMLTFPVQVAVRFRIPLIVWGVHGWSDQTGMFSHLDEVEMTEKCRKEHSLLGVGAQDLISSEEGITERDVQPFVYPSDEELERVGVRGLYLSNYIRWDAKAQHERMIDLYGYETAEQQRTFNPYEDVHCFHSAGIHDYIKFLKYGYGKVTDHASREIRLRRMTREQGIRLVERYAGRMPDDLPMFLEWAEISEDEFWACVDNRRDPQIWKRTAKGWSLRDTVANHATDPGTREACLPRRETECAYTITTSREPHTPEDGYLLMGRGYIDRNNFGSHEPSPGGGHWRPVPARTITF